MIRRERPILFLRTPYIASFPRWNVHLKSSDVQKRAMEGFSKRIRGLK